jgi:hypothetical protein
LLTATVVAQSAALKRRAHFPSEEDLLYLPKPAALRHIALGHTELMADLIFIRAVVYFGTQLTEKGDYRWLENYLETITELDPYWKTPYTWAGVATMYNGRPITNREVLASNRFLELGIRQFPTDWELPFMLACNYLFELKTDDPRQRQEWKHVGGEWVRHAAAVGGAPSWVPLLAATILRQEGQDEAAIHHLEEVYVTTQDDKTRQEVGNQLKALHAKIDFAKADRERKEFELAWRKTLPYASPDFFIVVGAPPSPRLDARALGPLAGLTAQPEDSE